MKMQEQIIEIENKMNAADADLKQRYIDLEVKIKELKSDHLAISDGLKVLLSITKKREDIELTKFDSILNKLNNLAFDKIQLKNWIASNIIPLMSGAFTLIGMVGLVSFEFGKYYVRYHHW